MLGRFLHFYPGYTVESALDLPWEQFVALYGVIPKLEAEELLQQTESRAYAANPGEKGRQLSNYIKRLRKALGSLAVKKSTVIPGVTPLTMVDSSGEIAAIRERQRLAAERLEQERKRHG